MAAEPHGFSAIMPGLGFLRDLFTEPFLVHWSIADGWATSEQIPGIRIPGSPFMGVSAVAPSHAEVAEWSAREQALVDRVASPFRRIHQELCRARALQRSKVCARCLRVRTVETSMVKQLTRGSTLELPVSVEGGLFSTAMHISHRVMARSV